MKYTKGEESVSFVNWTKSNKEWLSIIGFVNQIFSDCGIELDRSIPVPVVELVNFFDNTKNYTFCVDRPSYIYINEDFRGKKLHTALITALVKYYAINHYKGNLMDTEQPSEVTEKVLEVLEGLTVSMTMEETILTGGIALGGFVVLKTIF